MTEQNNKMPTVKVLEEYDGFVIMVDEQYFRFDQEDTKEDLIKVFAALGIEASYEEVY